jgi:hypothetical protein
MIRNRSTSVKLNTSHALRETSPGKPGANSPSALARSTPYHFRNMSMSRSTAAPAAMRSPLRRLLRFMGANATGGGGGELRASAER